MRKTPMGYGMSKQPVPGDQEKPEKYFDREPENTRANACMKHELV